MSYKVENDAQYVPTDAMLETVFSRGHTLHDRVLYDRRVGQYYDRYTDMFLTLEDCRAFGMPV